MKNIFIKSIYSIIIIIIITNCGLAKIKYKITHKNADVINKEFVYLYSEPNKNSDKIAEMYRKDIVEVLESIDDNWVKINYKGPGLLGYTLKSYVSKYEEVSGKKYYDAVINNIVPEIDKEFLPLKWVMNKDLLEKEFDLENITPSGKNLNSIAGNKKISTKYGIFNYSGVYIKESMEYDKYIFRSFNLHNDVENNNQNSSYNNLLINYNSFINKLDKEFKNPNTRINHVIPQELWFETGFIKDNKNKYVEYMNPKLTVEVYLIKYQGIMEDNGWSISIRYIRNDI